MKLVQVLVCVALAMAASSSSAWARGHRSHESHRSHRHRSHGSHRRSHSRKTASLFRFHDPCATARDEWELTDDGGLRDSNGRLMRNRAARLSFVCENPCPSTGSSEGPCPGYVVDHIKPLKEGGADLPSNMQWQTEEDAREKDRVE